ncbi:MAG: lysophospholipid acyltransferase family protein [Chloroflexota bacterium]
MLTGWAWHSMRMASRVAPPSSLRRAATIATWLGFTALPGKRANILRNMRVVLTGSPELGSGAVERKARRLALLQMAGYGEVLVDFIALPRIAPRVREETRDTAGWEHLDRALGDRRGVVFATIHFGSWDAAGAAVAGHCPPGTVFAVAEPFGDTRLDALVTKERAEYGLGVVPMHDVRRMVKLLRGGNVLGVLIDRPVTSGDGVTVRMFGRDTTLPAGAAALAAMARCPIIPGYLRRRPDGSFEGGILPAIEPVRTGNREADLAATMQQVVAGLEGIIRRSPHQWYMFRDMWPASVPATRAVGEGRLTALRLRRAATRTAGYGSVLMAAWYASRLPVVRSAWKAMA